MSSKSVIVAAGLALAALLFPQLQQQASAQSAPHGVQCSIGGTGSTACSAHPVGKNCNANFRSAASPAAPISFTNDSSQAIQIVWLNYQGQRVPYSTLAPGQQYSANTFVRHPWLLLDAQGKCIAVVFAMHSPIDIRD